MLKKLYDKIMYLASHQNSTKFLCWYSFLEAIILPLPIDMFLGPIAMQKPHHAFRLAFYATFFSLLGGMVGYTIGFFASDLAHQLLTYISNNPSIFDEVQALIHQYGDLLIVIVGFTPIPFKVFSIVFGVFQLDLIRFVVLSFLARMARFLIISYLFAIFGNKYRERIEKIIATSGWYILSFCIIAYVVYKYML